MEVSDLICNRGLDVKAAQHACFGLWEDTRVSRTQGEHAESTQKTVGLTEE